MGQPTISVITVCMNRQQHLRIAVDHLAAWPYHVEHLILDWSSQRPLRREHLPPDPRIRLHRVEGESRWNLGRAYNFAASLAQGDVLCKLDADCWPAATADPLLLLQQGPIWLGTGGGGSAGQFLMQRAWFEAIGGFHEGMQGWGFDDKDLRARLDCVAEAAVADLPEGWLVVIPHADHTRVSAAAGRCKALSRHHALAALRASRLHNRLVAAHHPWGGSRPHSRYQRLPGDDAVPCWRVEPSSVPVLAAKLRRSLEQQRRRSFWNVFLAIPDPAIDILPEKLLPADALGEWPVRWWHRLYWFIFMPLLMGPAWFLSLLRGVGRWRR